MGAMPNDPRLSTVAWRRLRLLVLARDGHRCQVAGPDCATVATCVDHIVARADGGDCWAPSNLRASCHKCNAQAAAARTNARRFAYATTLADYETRF
jgi:5-methylcytosine-specific restriction protein A